MPRTKAFANGLASTEYGLTLTLMGLTSLTALSLLGGNLADVLNPLKNSGSQAQAAVSTSGGAAGGSGSGTSAVTGPGSTLPKPATNQEQACFESGWCVNVPVVQAQSVASTTGSMGVKLTREFSNVIMQIAKQADALQNKDPQLVSLITQLANAGHKIGDAQEEVISICPSNTLCVTSNPMTLDLKLQGVGTQASSFESASRELQRYLDDHPASLPIEMQRIISMESDEILKIADAFDTNSDFGVDMQSTSLTQSWQLSGDASLTHQSANTICENGGNQGQCKKTG